MYLSLYINKDINKVSVYNLSAKYFMIKRHVNLLLSNAIDILDKSLQAAFRGKKYGGL